MRDTGTRKRKRIEREAERRDEMMRGGQEERKSRDKKKGDRRKR